MEIKTPKQVKEDAVDDQAIPMPQLNLVPKIRSANGKRIVAEEQKRMKKEENEMNSRLSRQNKNKYIESGAGQFEDSKGNPKEGGYLYNLKEK